MTHDDKVGTTLITVGVVLFTFLGYVNLADRPAHAVHPTTKEQS